MTATTDRTFDWVSNHDEESRNFPVSALASSVPRRAKLWRPGRERLDQGREGACVGFAWTGELISSPNRTKLANGDGFALELYREAQRLDVWPGENYSGTSVLAGAKASQKAGYIGEYRWAFGIEQVIDALISVGPVVIGIPWLSGMYETRPSGLVEVSGDVVGGHAITLTGYHPRMRIRGEGWHIRHEIIKWRNSWGKGYGRCGDGYIRKDDLARLLSQDGEACVPTQRFTSPR